MKEVTEKFELKKLFKKENLIVVVLLGILLVIAVGPTKSTKTSSKDTETEVKSGVTQLVTTAVDEGNNTTYSDISTNDYTTTLEKKVEKLLANMDGVGKVQVMITLKTSEELVVEKDEASTRNNTTENDSEGGTRTTYQLQSDVETVYSGQGTTAEPYVVKTIFPKIEGVVVLAQGVGTGTISKDILEAVQALFGVEAHKIKVLKMT